MKHLPLKLGIFVVLLFSVVITACLLWTPVSFIYLKKQLQSDDDRTRHKAIQTVIKRKHNALPYLSEWLESENNRILVGVVAILDNISETAWKKTVPYVTEWIVSGDTVKNSLACQTLMKMEGNSWQFALPEIELAVSRSPSECTERVAGLLLDKNHVFRHNPRYLDWYFFRDNNKARRNISLCAIKTGSYSHLAERFLENADDPLIIKPMLSMLRNESDPRGRYRAAEVLNDYADNPEIYKQLAYRARNDNDKHVREEAIEVLKKPQSIDLLEDAMKNDEHDTVRDNAISNLSAMKHPRATDILVKAILDPAHKKERRWITLSIGSTYSPKAIKVLIETMEDNSTDLWTRSLAAMELGEMYADEAAPHLIRILKTAKDIPFLCSAVKALGMIRSPDAVEPIINLMLTTEDGWTRFECVKILGAFRDQRAADPLIELARRPEIKDKDFICRSIGQLGDNRAADMIIEFIEKQNVKSWSLNWAIRDYGDERCQKKLIDAFFAGEYPPSDHDNWSILNSINEASESTAADFFRLLLSEKKYSFTREHAAGFLIESAGPEDAKLLLSLLKEIQDKKAVYNIIRALAATENNAAIPVLLEKIDSPEPDICSVAITALSRHPGIDVEKTVPLIIRKLDSGEKYVRVAAIQALGNLHTDAALDKLSKILSTDNDSYVLHTTFKTLLEIGTPQALHIVLDLFEDQETAEWFFKHSYSIMRLVIKLEPKTFFKVLDERKNKNVPEFEIISALYGKEISAERLMELDFADKSADVYRNFLLVERGKKEAFIKVFPYLDYYSYPDQPFIRRILALMPEDMPKPHMGKDRGLWNKSTYQMMFWFYNNKDRLAWDENKRKYYLKTEEKK